jgi:GxxExxY protein
MDTRYFPTDREESLAKTIVDCAFTVHNNFGPGLLEAIYEHCFCHELQKRNIPYESQISRPLVYDGSKLPWGLRLDVLIEGRIVCELKAVESVHPVYMAQLLTQLKLTDLHLGFLINFNVALIKEGIRRVIR